MKTRIASLIIATLVWVASVVTSQPGFAQTLNESGPMVSVHHSKGRLDPARADFRAIAEETTNALAGRIEQPVMAPTRSSFLAKWEPVAGATGYRLDVSTTPSFDSYVA